MFSCLTCAALLNLTQPDIGHVLCSSCGARYDVVDDVPVLLRNRADVDDQIQAATSQQGRAHWYEKAHDTQFKGRWRHHYRKRRIWLDQQLQALFPEPVQTALDIGCGDGHHIGWLKGYANTVYGSDYNIVRLRRARAVKEAAQVALADITDFPMAQDQLDLVFFNHVLEHIPAADKALQEIYRILRPGGVVIIGVPNEGAAFWQLAYKLQPRLKATSDHVHFFTMDSLETFTQAAGFQTITKTHIGWGVPHFSLDGRLRQFKWIDDLFTAIGRRLIPAQASSLYLIARKP